MIHTVFLKAFWIAFSSKQAAGVSWERSNGAGEREKKLVFHSCVHATSSKTAVTPVSWYSAVLSASRRSI